MATSALSRGVFVCVKDRVFVCECVCVRARACMCAYKRAQVNERGRAREREREREIEIENKRVSEERRGTTCRGTASHNSKRRADGANGITADVRQTFAGTDAQKPLQSVCAVEKAKSG